MPVDNKYRKRKQKKKPFLRRLLAQLGILPLTNEMALVYTCIFIVLVVLYKPIMDFSTMYLF